MFKKILKILIIIIYLVACFVIGLKLYPIRQTGQIEANKVDEETYRNSIIKVYNVYEYHYELLSAREQYIYKDFLTGLSKYKDEFTINLKNMTFDEIETAFKAIYYDHPELFYIDNFTVTINKYSATITPKYAYSKDKSREINNEMRLVYTNIINEAKKKNKIEEKIRYVHDAIIDLSPYYEYKDYDDIRTKKYQSFISVFTKKKSVCAGYTYAFKFIMDNLDIKSISMVDENELNTDKSHVWNAVLIDSEWKYIDITWDAKRYKDGHNKYQYFLLKQKDFFKTHNVQKTLP